MGRTGLVKISNGVGVEGLGVIGFSSSPTFHSTVDPLEVSVVLQAGATLAVLSFHGTRRVVGFQEDLGEHLEDASLQLEPKLYGGHLLVNSKSPSANQRAAVTW